MALKAPCDIILDAIEDDEKRDLAQGLFFFVLNTRGGAPSDAARRLAAASVEELRAARVQADRQCDELREREQTARVLADVRAMDLEADCGHAGCVEALVQEVVRVGIEAAESVCVIAENQDNENYFQGERREQRR